MTNQEAIEMLKIARKEAIGKTLQQEALDVAITALEMQEPMKVTEIDEEYGYYVCPSCGEKITAMSDFKDHHCCLNCGQHLKWSDENDEQ